MINADLARAFERIADLMEITGGDRFRVNSYRRVSRTIGDLTDDIADIAARGKLTDLPGVGKGTADRIAQFLETGTIDVLDDLESRLPVGLPELLSIPGMGPKKVAAVHEKLGVGGTDDLKRVIESGELANLPGFGETSVKRIADGIAFLETSGGRTALGIAQPLAEAQAERVAGIRGVKRVAVAGSLRRGAETIGDVDLLCEASNGREVVEAFVNAAVVKRVLASGDTKGSVTVESPDRRELQIDLRVVPAESYGAALQYFTGSKEHNVRLRELAVNRKWRLNEYGLFDGETRLAGATEEEIYARLGLPCFPPELREDRGEFEDPGCVDDLLDLSDIRGDLHVHTIASDGMATIEEMAKAAKALGYKYIAICDHSKSSAIANGLSTERMERHIEDIRAVERKLKGIAVLVGCEVDILSDGSLDYPDDILRECDLVTASIHFGMQGAKTSPTRRTLAAMENPYVNIIGHPTGRLLGQRPPMDVDMAAIVKGAAESGTALEINAAWARLDLKDIHVRQAIDAGAMLAVCTDAHSTGGLATIGYGVTTARRGRAAKRHVLNARPLGRVRQWLAGKRDR
ncbi:MAG: DNA polymerase/3'-5' exonuclease PolX [Phycisphaerales bacterium]|nr:MAG: DNA polymerase/3'-5' exonuclease PolX [Phycisphaerales bacterium]